MQACEQLMEDKVEQEEEEESRRKASIIVHGLIESEAMEADQQYQDDSDQLADILHCISCDKVNVQ